MLFNLGEITFISSNFKCPPSQSHQALFLPSQDLYLLTTSGLCTTTATNRNWCWSCYCCCVQTACISLNSHEEMIILRECLGQLNIQYIQKGWMWHEFSIISENMNQIQWRAILVIEAKLRSNLAIETILEKFDLFSGNAFLRALQVNGDSQDKSKHGLYNGKSDGLYKQGTDVIF
ncbi:Hypothetical_protein [Hexamita inflata]|uniref:Hypothetical_protein n=1 Tax=Hexamita inflata TaxID=28002 RepID=A0AA86TWB6_9EUKA|nr:Hypothetical protein HINF_LOCUS18391 [Hexamita inflata]